ncbi:acyl-CoA dehydrogenase family protein [Halorarum salinum]|uniref:Acyl-CoA dehydrogenase family protein n=1 Tax=Halorarum salinum TaxID=2743089 RepID=A0A7D5LCV1_9EURY|nr:acyl-CoA dehydrogenase family protein [Halobaculum salinum]QLG63886.1 acyl-CoA dehydrogenase family protein [Halobaculum salinum]
MRLIESALDDGHREVRDRADAFAEDVVVPRAAGIEASDEFPRDVIEEAGERGLLGLLLPEGYGEVTTDFLGYCLAVERIAAESGAVAETIQGHTFAALPIARFGTEAQREEHLPAMADGSAVGAMLLTEPDAGSAPSGLASIAEATDDGYRLSGEKSFGTNAGVADVHLVVARRRPESDDSHGVSVFLVPSVDDADGFEFERAEYMGMRGHVTGDSTLEGVHVPAGNLLGEVGQGFRIAMGTIDMARTGLGAIGVGIARAAFDEAVAYAGDREQGGSPVGEYQAVQVLVADMYRQFAGARHLVYSSAAEIAAEGGDTRASSLAKLAGSEAAEFVTRNAIQVHGGTGYRKGTPVERYYRDAKILSIIGGTSEIQRTTIAGETLDL